MAHADHPLTASADGDISARRLLCGARAAAVVPGRWSRYKDYGSGGMAAGHLGQRLNGIGETVAGRDRNRQLAVCELRSELAQTRSVRAE